jgi:cell division protein FtsW (lipid II flippase)
MMTLVFGATLAFARAHQDDDRFFAPVAGVLASLLAFLRYDSLMVIVGLAAAMVLVWLVRDKRPRAGFVLPLLAGLTLGVWYLVGPMRAYVELPRRWLGGLPLAGVAGGVIAVITTIVLLRTLSRRYKAEGRSRAGLDALVSGGYVVVLLTAAA